MATDTHGREFGPCERDYALEACAAPAPPPPPPPPAPTSCGALLTAEQVKGGWNLNVDGSSSAAGASPAARADVQLIGPDGSPVPFVYQGKTQSEVELGPPFTATFFVPKAKRQRIQQRVAVARGNGELPRQRAGRLHRHRARLVGRARRRPQHGQLVVGFGVPVGAEGAGGSRLHVIGEGRLFFDSPDGVDNNYQLWGGTSVEPSGIPTAVP